MANRQIGSLPQATAITDSDLFAIEQGGIGKKLSGQAMSSYLKTFENAAKEASDAAIQAKTDAANSATQAAAEVTNARNQVDLAKFQVNLAKAEVLNAKAEVVNAQDQVALAVAEVTKAKAEVQNAKNEVDNAAAQVDLAKSEVTKAQGYADNAASSAASSEYWANQAEAIVGDGGVSSFNGRTGRVSPMPGDYSLDMIDGTDDLVVYETNRKITANTFSIASLANIVYNSETASIDFKFGED